MRADFDWSRSAPMYMRAYQLLRPDVAVNRIPERRRSMVPVRSWAPVLADVERAGPRADLAAGKMRRTLGSGSGAGVV